MATERKQIAPLPKFDGPGSANNANSPFQHTQQQSQMPLPQRQASISNMDIVSPEDRQKYIGLFQSFGPINNILSGKCTLKGLYVQVLMVMV